MKKALALAALLTSISISASAYTQYQYFYFNGKESPITTCDRNWPGSEFDGVYGNYVRCVKRF